MQGMFIANPGDQGHSSVGNGNENAISCDAYIIYIYINVQLNDSCIPPTVL